MDIGAIVAFVGGPVLLGLLFLVGCACYQCYTREERRARLEARALREERLDRVVEWFLARAVDVDRRIRGGPRPPVRGNRVTHVRSVRSTSPIPVMSRDRDMTSIPMLAWEQA